MHDDQVLLLSTPTFEQMQENMRADLVVGSLVEDTPAGNLAVDSPAGGSLELDTLADHILADHILAGHTLAVHSLAVVRTGASEPVTRSSRPLRRLYETSNKTWTVLKGLPSR